MRSYNTVSFEHILYFDEDGNETMVEVEARVYLGSTAAMGDDPDDIEELVIRAYNEKTGKYKNVTDELTLSQYSEICERVYEEVL